MKILDTDHCVALLRGQLDIRGIVPPDEDLWITAITVGELTHGAHKSARPMDNLARLDALFAVLSILSFDDSAARRFGQLKAQLERAGEPIADLDLQIASIAIEHALPLVTHNSAHFSRLTASTNLVLEDWLN